MCQRELLDFDTYVRVRKAAPLPTHTPPAAARKILEHMQSCMLDSLRRIGMDNKGYWEVDLREFWEQLEPMTPRKVGWICRSMGLSLHRLKQGYQVTWTFEQVEILREYFNA